MNKRTVVLCASFGTLVLSAAHAPVPLGPSSGSPDAQPDTQAHAHLSEHAQVASPSEEASFEQLSAAYAQTQAPGPVTASKSARASRPAHPSNPTRFSNALASPLEVEEPTLWLARAIYSETKLPHEQELVAWVVRNRVETGYRGKDTYREVVLDPYQFSAFNPGSSKRPLLTRLRPESSLPGWRQALWVARYVRHAAPVYRPFSIETRHFYSERSMKKRPVPYWAESSRFVPAGGPRYTIDERRFRFYEQIS
jgi:hypothetical protein